MTLSCSSLFLPVFLPLLIVCFACSYIVFSFVDIHTSVIENSIHANINSNLHNENSHRKILEVNNDDDDDHDEHFKETEVRYLESLVANTYDDVHIVFTTGCSGYQNWQSENLIYSWARIKQPGRITRIIAGCKTDGERLKANTTAVPNPDQRIQFYFIPDYTPEEGARGGRKFHYFNKPFGMKHWIENADKQIYENVIILLDPDMLLVKQFLFHIKSEAAKQAQFQKKHTSDGNDTPEPRDLHCREGNPISQKYGIGGKWVEWKGFCEERSSCRMKSREAWKYYSIGPPYIMHKNDWKKVVPLWTKYSPHALELEPQPSILAEMYSFVIACAYHDLKHQYLFSMVSDPGSSIYMENWNNLNWDYLDATSMADETAIELRATFNFHIIHYCQGYWLGQTRNQGTIRLGGWNWHKGHVPQEILYNCEIPLLVELRDDELHEDRMALYQSRDVSKENRHVWILYHLYKFTNEAVLNYRLKYCPAIMAAAKLTVGDGGDGKGDGDGPLYKPEYKLVLQQPEADAQTHRRMNYVFNDYASKVSWRGH